MRRFDIYSVIVYVGIVAYAITLSYYTILKYYTFHTHAADLGIFAQALASTLYYHRLFYESVDVAIIPKPGPIGYSFLDVHFSPTLFLLLPIYAVYPSPTTLLIAQSVIVALGALPIYWLGRWLGRENLGALFALAYLMNPLVQGANSFDFHMETLFMPLALYATYALLTRKWSIYYPLLLLTLGIIEFAPIPMALLGIYYIAKNLRRRVVVHGVATAVISMVVLVLALWLKSVLNPAGPTTASPLSGLPMEYASSFDLGVLVSIFRNPWLIINLYTVHGTRKFLYFLELYSPTAFTAFLDPLVLPSLAWPLASFLTNNVIYYSPYFQYSSFSIPFIMMASLMALSKLPSDLMRRFTVLIVISTVIVLLGVSPLIHFQYAITSTDREIWNAISQIPSNATVLVQNNLYPPFSNDINAYTQWYPWLRPEYIIAQPSSPWFTWWGTPYNEYVNLALSNGYGVYMVLGNSLLVLKANYTGPPVVCKPLTIKIGPNELTIINGEVQGDTIVHTPNEPPGQWFTTTQALPPGLYSIEVTYGWSGPQYLRAINTTLALIRVGTTTINLSTDNNNATTIIKLNYYTNITITAYANYIVNTTVYVNSITIKGPLCG